VDVSSTTITSSNVVSAKEALSALNGIIHRFTHGNQISILLRLFYCREKSHPELVVNLKVYHPVPVI